MRSYEEIKRSDLKKLSAAEAILLSLHKDMMDIRYELNRSKRVEYSLEDFSKYLEGKIDGLWYGMTTYLIWKDYGAYEELSLLISAFNNEINFLSGKYQDE